MTAVNKHNHDLVAAIGEKMPLSDAVRHAFLSVDRAVFVPHYSTQVGSHWVHHDTGSDAYEDRPLVTKVHNGRPVCSSSQPSVMAAMLEALDVQPDSSVLEIGAGTGYNAALISKIVGLRGHVDSIEIDPDLAQLAREHLEEAGIDNVWVHHGNGECGYPGRLYNRIIITAGFRNIYPSWIDQLGEGGILVGNLQGSLSTVLIKVMKDRHESISATLLEQGAFFMEMHGEEYPVLHVPNWQEYDALPWVYIQAEPSLINVVNDQAFLFYLQQRCPLLQVYYRLDTPERPNKRMVIIDTQTHGSVTFVDGTVVDRGVWLCIEEQYSQYLKDGSPCEYRLLADRWAVNSNT